MSVITGMKQINSKVATILQPHKGLRVSEGDRRRLVAIHKRVECLVQPLNFCVVWAKEKDSCIHPILQYAYDLLHSVTDFLDKVKFTTEELDPFTRVLDTESSKRVDHFLRELEFASNSVSLAVSVTRMFSTNNGGQISPSALLKASARIREMANQSGDLFAISGTLYKRSVSSDRWDRVDEQAVLKLSQFKSIDPMDSPYLIRVSNLNFPIQTALSFHVTGSKSLNLPINSIIDSLVISWQFSEADVASSPLKRRLLHRNPSGEIDPELSQLSLDSSDEEAIVVHGPADIPCPLRPRVSSTQISGPDSVAEYAFSHASSGMSCIDLVYIARLCVLEAIRQPSFFPRSQRNPNESPASPKSALHLPLHFEASDETLMALLLDAKVVNSPYAVDNSSQEQIDLVVNAGDRAGTPLREF